MSRQAERALLGIVGFLAAVLVLYAGIRLITGDSSDGIAEGFEVGAGLDGADGSDPGSADDATGVERDGDGRDGDQSGGVGQSPLTVDATSSTAGPGNTSSTASTSATATGDGGESDQGATSSSTTVRGQTTISADPAAARSSTTAASSSTTSPRSTSTSSSTTQATTTSSSTTTVAVEAGLTSVEREVIRLTNQLRSDPSGPLRRVAPMPGCVDDDFFRIDIDQETGHPRPVPPLAVDERVSTQMARDWSVRMADADQMTHRSNESQSAIYTALGINRARSSENVAWLSGYPESSTAMQLFVGWRESSTGHYCSLVAGSLTHIGVGHHRTGEGKDWATQNFYALR